MDQLSEGDLEMDVKESQCDGMSEGGKKSWEEFNGPVGVDALSSTLRSKHSSKALRNAPECAIIPPGELKMVRRLGEGAYATVDLCIYSSSQGQLCPVAVKQLKPHALKIQTDLQCFLNEARLLQKMRHPFIVDFFGVGFTDMEALEFEEPDISLSQERVYLVQEFMSKGTLKSLVQRQMCSIGRRIYSNTQALKWALQVAKGLQYLHKIKPTLIHRDVKMDNILLNENDDGEIVAKLADFGLCVMVDYGGTPVSGMEEMYRGGGRGSVASHFSMCSTQDDVLAAMYDLSGKTGSLMYMAPEVLRFEKYNEKCDIFSFGVILYELFTRETLLTFVSCTGEPGEIERYARSVASGYRPYIPEYLPTKLIELIKMCWASNMKERPSASRVVRALDDMLQDAEMLTEMEQVPTCNCCALQ